MNQVLQVEPNGAEECRHHWMIAPPGGPTSSGVCKRCGAHRDFRNSTDDYLGDGSGGSDRLEAAAGASAAGLSRGS